MQSSTMGNEGVQNVSATAEQTKIREQQKAAWNLASVGWRKRDDFNMRFIAFARDAIIDALDLKPTDHVLDLATGTGEPGLSIAKLVPQGGVIGCDLAEKMLEVAHDKAAATATANYSARVADACALPFADKSFDAVSCRFGFMFFADVEIAAAEIARVLKPGGRVAVTVWGSAETNTWISVFNDVIGKYVELPKPVPGGPGMYRCAERGLLAGIFAKVGLIDARDEVFAGTVAFGSSEDYLALRKDAPGPQAEFFANADAAVLDKFNADLKARFDAEDPGPEGNLRYEALLVTAKKP